MRDKLVSHTLLLVSTQNRCRRHAVSLTPSLVLHEYCAFHEEYGHRASVELTRHVTTERGSVLTTLAKSPSSSLMTPEKLRLVKSRNSQHLRIVARSHPEVACSVGFVMSRFGSCQILYWRRIRNSRGWVRRRVSIDAAPIMSSFLSRIRIVRVWRAVWEECWTVLDRVSSNSPRRTTRTPRTRDRPASGKPPDQESATRTI